MTCFNLCGFACINQLWVLDSITEQICLNLATGHSLKLHSLTVVPTWIKLSHYQCRDKIGEYYSEPIIEMVGGGQNSEHAHSALRLDNLRLRLTATVSVGHLRKQLGIRRAE